MAFHIVWFRGYLEEVVGRRSIGPSGAMYARREALRSFARNFTTT